MRVVPGFAGDQISFFRISTNRNDSFPPTGRTVAYPGASFTQIEGDKIHSEHTYLDRQTVAEQLGLKAK
jgi:predicted ester cyclase